MNREEAQVASILHELQERAKELNCLYRVDELLSRSDLPLQEVLRSVVEILPPGWQYPHDCQARIVLDDSAVESPNFQRTEWVQTAAIVVQGQKVGSIEVSYRHQMPRSDEGPFLKEERKLINTIADRIADHIMQRRLKAAFARLSTAADGCVPPRGEWCIVLDFLRDTDPVLLQRISRKLVNHLAWNGVAEAKQLLERSGIATTIGAGDAGGENRPIPRDGSGKPRSCNASQRGLRKKDPASLCVHWSSSIRRWAKSSKPSSTSVTRISTKWTYRCPSRKGCGYRSFGDSFLRASTSSTSPRRSSVSKTFTTC